MHFRGTARRRRVGAAADHRIPFETHAGLIFLRATLDKQEARLLLDTGSNVSFSFSTAVGLRLDGDHFKTTDEYPSRVVFRYPDILKDSQGIVGQDILREFPSILINYEAHVVELEK